MKAIFRYFFKLFLWCFALSIGLVFVYKFVPVPVTPLMVIRYFENDDPNKNLWKHDWLPIVEISKNLQLAVICSEDQNFLHHKGFDMEAIEKAFERNKKGKRIRGASSISQQTAKNVFLWQGRSYLRKGLEAYFTVLIEIFWGKERIMEVYLNSIEMGDGVYGVEAASQHWYRKSAKLVSKREAAGIAAILPNPRKFKASNSSSYTERRKGRIMKHMNYVKLDY